MVSSKNIRWKIDKETLFLKLKVRKIIMTNEEFVKLYNMKLQELKEKCEEQVKNGELTEEEASFRFEMVKDDILYMMPDPV